MGSTTIALQTAFGTAAAVFRMADPRNGIASANGIASRSRRRHRARRSTCEISRRPRRSAYCRYSAYARHAFGNTGSGNSALTDNEVMVAIGRVQATPFDSVLLTGNKIPERFMEHEPCNDRHLGIGLYDYSAALAFSISDATSLGYERNMAWLPGSAIDSDLALPLMNRPRSGLIIRSRFAMTA